jgi:hypothetical protein
LTSLLELAWMLGLIYPRDHYLPSRQSSLILSFQQQLW